MYIYIYTYIHNCTSGEPHVVNQKYIPRVVEPL